jgi:DNA repair exonuclease SbcCD nuclease subunit
MNFLVIGDIHFKIDNIPESYEFIKKIQEYILSNIDSIDYIVILGDVLHTHEKVHTQALNVALDFFTMLCNMNKTVYTLVGNHDMTTNTNFLNNLHWMNCLKEWKNIIVVDKIISLSLNHHTILFSPFVPDGRFIEALNTFPNWQTTDLIFAHQLLNGVQMGAIFVDNIEEWKDDYPMCISGHIHQKQKIKDNLYYTGSCRQISFGELDNKTICMVSLSNKQIDIKEIELELPIKKIIYMNAEEIDKQLSSLFIKKNEKIKVVITGDETFFKEIKKTDKIRKLLLSKGIEKVICKKIKDQVNDQKENKNDFLELLDLMVKEQDDNDLFELYKEIMIQ